MPNRNHRYMFWVDLETTGSELSEPTDIVDTYLHHVILEVGVAITDLALDVLETKSYVIGNRIEHDKLKQVVIDMHNANGLWQDVLDSDETIEDVDRQVSDLIRKYNGADHMIFAGSGVGHFDRKWIKRDMPLTDKRITHYPIDVGVNRREYEILLGGTDWPEDEKTHRALDDVLFHIKELKFALDIMRRGMVR